MGVARVRGVAHLARSDGGPVFALHQSAGARRRAPARARHGDLLPERGIDEFRDAAAGGTRLVVAGVRLCRLRPRERVWTVAEGPGERLKQTKQRKELFSTPHDVR